MRILSQPVFHPIIKLKLLTYHVVRRYLSHHHQGGRPLKGEEHLSMVGHLDGGAISL